MNLDDRYEIPTMVSKSAIPPLPPGTVQELRRPSLWARTNNVLSFLVLTPILVAFALAGILLGGCSIGLGIIVGACIECFNMGAGAVHQRFHAPRNSLETALSILAEHRQRREQ